MANRHKPINEILEIVARKLIGHFNYYGITDNFHSIRKYRWIILGYLYKYLNRRSQRKSFTWTEFEKLIQAMQFPKARIKVNIYTI